MATSRGVIYKSNCPAGVGCTYRPGEWTQSVMLEPATQSFVTAVPDGTSYLYLFHRGESTSSIYWFRKWSE